MRFNITNLVNDLSVHQGRMGVESEPEMPAAERQKLRETGAEVNSGTLPPDPEGILRWKGEAVVLYIRDQTSVPSHGVSTYKFHLSECSTIRSMRSRSLYGRYVVSNRDDGRFPAKASGWHRDTTRLVRMQVCRNCLKSVDWDGYGSATYLDQEQIVQRFDIRAYFDVYRNVRNRPPALAPEPVTVAPPPTPPPPVHGPDTGSPPSSGSAPPPPLFEPDWSLAIPDKQFRAAMIHIDVHGLLSESDLVRLVGSPRRARRFNLAYRKWVKLAPFEVTMRTRGGQRTYCRSGGRRS